MTTPADDLAAERAFEASLAGRAVPDGAAFLAAFTEGVRASATGPGRPNAALAELLATGLLTHQPSPSPRAVREKSRMKILPLLAAKLTAGGGLAKAAVGTGVVLVALTGGVAAATEGADLFSTVSNPAPDQETDVTGGQPEGSGDDVGAGEGDGEDVTGGDTTGGGDAGEDDGSDDVNLDGDATEGAPAGDADAAVTDPAATEPSEQDWLKGPVDGQTFGQWVSQGRHLGYATGERVSQAAHDRNDARRAAREQAPEQDSVQPPASAPADEPDDQSETEVSAGTSGDGGTGGGKGSGGAGNGKGQGKK